VTLTLRLSDPPVYLIFLLGVAAGLRRKEIDLLEWSAFRFKENTIRVEPTQFFHPKSQDSIAEIQVDPEVMSVFQEHHDKAKGTFVIASRRPPKTVTRGDYYRCQSYFDKLNAWLRSKGVNTQKPLHTLRKEYGSLINKMDGIHAASKALRHADISVTNNFYTDSRARVTPGLGKLFARKKSAKRLSRRTATANWSQTKRAKQPRQIEFEPLRNRRILRQVPARVSFLGSLGSVHRP
jgi:integrase